MRYAMLRLFLTRRDEGTLLGMIAPARQRQEYLKAVFASEIHFDHYQGHFVFTPFESPEPDFIVGVIAREHQISISGPPEEQYAHKQVVDWQTANVLIDTSGDTDGQKVAMQGTLGQPLSVFRSLVNHINDADERPEWLIAVNQITTRDQFWNVAERFSGHLKEIDFEFEVPNIWGGQSETEKALRELRDKNNAQEVEVKIKNKDGKLNPDSERIRQAVNYTSDGGGVARLRDDTDAVVYSSDREESAVSSPVVEPDPPIQDAELHLIRYLIDRIFRASK